MSKGGGLDKLSALVSGASQHPEEEMDESEEKIMMDAKKVLDYAAKIVPGGFENIFGMQMLIEVCAEEVRNQIRDMVEGEEDDE